MNYLIEKIYKIWNNDIPDESYVKVTSNSDGMGTIDITEIIEGEETACISIDKEGAAHIGRILLEISGESE